MSTHDGLDHDKVERLAERFIGDVGAAMSCATAWLGDKLGLYRVMKDADWLSPTELAWPDYDGNGQFRSLGNLLLSPRAGLLFVDWGHPSRLRVNGIAAISGEDVMLASWPGAQQVVRLAIEQVFPNCPRYLPRMQVVEASPYAPAPNHEPPRPGWKDDPRFRDALPARDRTP